MAKTQKLIHIFWDVSMAMQHTGLLAVVEKETALTANDMEEGDLFAFINRKQDKVKILAGLNEAGGNGVLGYYKSPKGRAIDITALQYIPQAFRGGKIDMSTATKKAVEAHLFRAKKRRITTGKYKQENTGASA